MNPPSRNMPAGRVIAGLEAVPAEARCGALTIGNFDGVHRGHQEILRIARALADPDRLPVVAVTFDPPPDLVLRPGDVPERLSTNEQKARWLIEAGADWVVFARATRELLSREPEDFVQHVITSTFAPQHVVEGHNFYFGRRRRGDVGLLQYLGEQFGFVVHRVDPVRDVVDGTLQRISSTLIRGLLGRGRVVDAAGALGRPYAISGRVVHGAGVGHTLGFPTVNLNPDQQILPEDGVYAGSARVEDRTWPAAISVGAKPTFGLNPRVLEAHLLDTGGDFYDRRVELAFLQRLREQRTYTGAEGLCEQIERDIARVRDICS